MMGTVVMSHAAACRFTNTSLPSPFPYLTYSAEVFQFQLPNFPEIKNIMIHNPPERVLYDFIFLLFDIFGTAPMRC